MQHGCRVKLLDKARNKHKKRKNKKKQNKTKWWDRTINNLKGSLSHILHIHLLYFVYLVQIKCRSLHVRSHCEAKISFSIRINYMLKVRIRGWKSITSVAALVSCFCFIIIAAVIADCFGARVILSLVCSNCSFKGYQAIHVRAGTWPKSVEPDLR